MMTSSYKNLNYCPVCGYKYHSPIYDELGELQADAFYMICPSCGYEFAVTDIDRGFSFKAWRSKWVKEGMPWKSSVRHKESLNNWNPHEQLKNIGVILDENNNIVKDVEDPAWHIIPKNI